MNYTQLNIRKGDQKFRYCVGYEPLEEYVERGPWGEFHYLRTGDEILFGGKEPCVKRVENIWTCVNPEDYVKFPANIKLAKIALFFPQWSVETYDKGGLYILNAATYIGGHRVDLCNTLINRMEQVQACSAPVFVNNTEYVEKVDVEIPDPWEVCYSDDWKPFRQWMSDNDWQGADWEEMNNEGAILEITLYPVVCSDDLYKVKEGYVQCSNVMGLGRTGNDLILGIKTSYNDDAMWTLNIEPHYNVAYQSFNEYLRETYNLTNPSYNVMATAQTDSDVYFIWTFAPAPSTGEVVILADQIRGQGLDSWDVWCEGLRFVASLTVWDEDGNDVMSIVSRELPITQEVMARILNDFEIGKIDIDNMDINRFDVVNKMETTTVTVAQPENNKSNIIQPVFFKSYDSQNIIVHRGVVETIGINLTPYKSKVDTFYLRIQDTDFMEVGRNSYNILFKVDGKQFSDSITSGTYYILNQDKELVTTGTYTYPVQ